ncbi:hypothetical protein QBC33DRAFT_450936 [Phialemonium atrogriseum]|uniref:CHY-type domain-containing protein n=1 Tax=Phialemonium atrogriseum TaxID=1093897 RepID=A0AAJ0C1F3_9PEZI|nr:uncharacterized protein QBC33DRAFT_450936 [Phialemonium atrogriseum]KAK1767762.1 hypothetical protein QBC33DRAFT_450936 [Phialemonium atrogriseum]
MIPTGSRGETRLRRPKQAFSEVSPNRVVPKPVPQSQVQNARGYHIEQLRRRYSPKETTNENGGTSLLFKLRPSDPDFPFELDHLECDLLVPAGYPKQPPQLRIKNKDIPRGFSINIEKGWDRLVEERRGATLLTLTNALDRKLEELLSEQKSETVKLTIFKDTRHLNTASPSSVPETPSAKPYVPPRRYVPEETFTREQIAEAKARRAQETRQLESRMGRLPLYSKSNDGIVYTLPLEPRRRTELPPGLKPTKSVQLIIPVLYPLQPPRVLLNDVESKDAEGVEELFTAKAVEQKQMTLMSHLNFLAQNIHTLARQAQASAAEKESGEAESAVEDVYIKAKEAEHSSALGGDDRSHIQVIPRPPEWCAGEESDGSSGSEDEDYSYDEEDEEDGGATLGEPSSAQPPATGQTAERGTALTFPSIELRGIELLQVSILSLGVRCERCKTINEISGLKDNVEKTGSCRKCTSGFVVKFRPELVHQNSIRAGFIDAAGCTVTELLPSTFIPTCATCSTPSGGLVSVRGEMTTNVCRECHSRFTFKLPEVKFLAYAPGTSSLRLPVRGAGPGRDAGRQHRAGEALPGHGACEHYRRSHRWFRFSCCGRVHACDRCHDGAEDHAHEWAARMVCGWCGREQTYRPESCAFCGRGVVGRRGGGYWEGGKGTRNRRLMRKGDSRKHKRVGGSEAAKG